MLGLLSHFTEESLHPKFSDCKWTPWFDRDNPSGTGDWETPLSALGAAACTNPLTIEGRRYACIVHACVKVQYIMLQEIRQETSLPNWRNIKSL